MKVCMISGLAKFAGGLENVVEELSKSLVVRDIAVDVFGKSNRDFVESHDRYRVIGVRPYSLVPHLRGIPRYGKYQYNLRTWRKSKTYGPYDLIHGHGDNCFFSSLFRDKTPFLLTFHGTMAKILEGVADPRLKPVRYPEKVAVARCDVAVACSRAVKNELTHYYGTSAEKIKVIYNGVDVGKFAPMDKKVARRKLGVPESGKYALWVGSNPIRKRLQTAVEAVEKSKCTKLLVVGMTGENMRKTVFLGKLPEDALIAAYNAADVLIFPTVYEGFPMVPLEALACGLPAIVSEESNLGEIIKEGTHGFVVKDENPTSYQRKIDQIINDEAALNQTSIKCRELALDYSWQKQANKYWLLYRSLLRNR